MYAIPEVIVDDDVNFVCIVIHNVSNSVVLYIILYIICHSFLFYSFTAVAIV